MLVVVLGLVACGGSPAPTSPASSPPPVAPPPAEPAASTGPAPWILGDWRHRGGEEHWVQVAGVTWGIALADERWEVMVIEAGADGTPALVAMPMGAAPTTFPATSGGRTALRFAKLDHSPAVITYRRDGDRLLADVEPENDMVSYTLEMATMPAVPAPAAEDADRAFAADTARDGVDGWVRHFAPDGALVRADARLEGVDAIRAAMTPLLSSAQLRWEPAWSRLGPSGTLAATIGHAQIVDGDQVTWRGTYATIWRRTADGWKVIFDVGRDAVTPAVE